MKALSQGGGTYLREREQRPLEQRPGLTRSGWLQQQREWYPGRERVLHPQTPPPLSTPGAFDNTTSGTVSNSNPGGPFLFLPPSARCLSDTHTAVSIFHPRQHFHFRPHVPCLILPPSTPPSICSSATHCLCLRGKSPKHSGKTPFAFPVHSTPVTPRSSSVSLAHIR